MNDSINSWRGRVSILAATFMAMVLIALGLAGLVSQAKAGPVTLTFDSGRLSVGPVVKDREILPATSQFPSDQLPVPQRTDIQLNGTQTGNDISFPVSSNSGMQFPYMNFANPIDPSVKVPFTFRLKDEGLNGTFDEATGEAHLAGNIDVVIVLGTGALFPLPDSLTDLAVPPLGLFARCRISDLPVDFSTETKAPFTAERYQGGLNGTGAMTTAWENVPQAVSENGTTESEANCEMVNQIIHSAGGLWLANGVEAPDPQPEPPAPTCETDRRLCPPPEFAEITDLTVTPKKKKVKAGKKVTLTARVTNSGNIAATGVVVKFKSTNKAVKVPASKTVTVPAGSTLPVKVVAKVKRKARRKAVIRASSNGWSATSVIKVKPLKKKVRKHRR